MLAKKTKKRRRACPTAGARPRHDRAPIPAPIHPLQEARRFSRSPLWKTQREYFTQAGSRAWQENVVPSYVTCNAYIARSYASVVMGLLRDALTRGERGTVHLLDIGAGSGQFAFHFLKKLAELYNDSPGRNKVGYRYVCTDFTRKNIDFCARHPAMQPFLAQGVLDFAELDVAKERPVKLLQSGESLQAGEIPGPLVLIANYLFDSIPQDLFCVQEGRLHECLRRLSRMRH